MPALQRLRMLVTPGPLLRLMAVLAASGCTAGAAAQPSGSPPHDGPPPGYGSPAQRNVAPSRWPGGDVYGWEQTLVDGIEVLFIDDALLPLAGSVPAGGPLQRFMSRPGAWYGVVFVPVAPRWPVQVWVWQRTRTHELRITAMDAAPWSPPAVSVPIPLRRTSAGGRPVLLTAPFVLAPNSQADGVFLLIEQWSLAGDRPPPLWLQARSRVFYDVDVTPWWATHPLAPDTPPGGLAPALPSSPLASPRRVDAVLELPILQRSASPPPPRDSWTPR